MTPEEVSAFLATGQNFMTGFAQAQEQLVKWSASFETRGGAAVYGDDATLIVYLSNDLVEFMTPERAATIARLRIDV